MDFTCFYEVGYYFWEENKNCRSFEPSYETNSIKAYSCDELDTWCGFEVDKTISLWHEGSIEFRYKKSTKNTRFHTRVPGAR